MSNWNTSSCDPIADIESIRRAVEKFSGLPPAPPPVVIITHPDNIPLIKREIERESNAWESAYFGSLFPAIQFRSAPWLERERWSGKYILPDGSIVPREWVRVETRFVSYGPEDLEYLVAIGVVKKHMEIVAYQFDASPAMSHSLGHMVGYGHRERGFSV